MSLQHQQLREQRIFKQPRISALWLHSFHSLLCLTTGPKPPLKRFLHIVRSRASSFNWEYPLLSLRSSSNFIRLLPRLLVTSISPFIFPSITCFRRQFLRKMWPIQLAFSFLISCRIFLCSLTYCFILLPMPIHWHYYSKSVIILLLNNLWVLYSVRHWPSVRTESCWVYFPIFFCP